MLSFSFETFLQKRKTKKLPPSLYPLAFENRVNMSLRATFPNLIIPDVHFLFGKLFCHQALLRLSISDIPLRQTSLSRIKVVNCSLFHCAFPGMSRSKYSFSKSRDCHLPKSNDYDHTLCARLFLWHKMIMQNLFWYHDARCRRNKLNYNYVIHKLTMYNAKLLLNKWLQNIVVKRVKIKWPLAWNVILGPFEYLCSGVRCWRKHYKDVEKSK